MGLLPKLLLKLLQFGLQLRFDAIDFAGDLVVLFVHSWLWNEFVCILGG